MRISLHFVLASVAALALPQLGTIDAKPKTSDTVLNAIKTFEETSNHKFTFLSTLISSARATIDGFTVPENYQLTVFVPSDVAFTTIPIDLLSNTQKLFTLVSYHVVPTVVDIPTIVGEQAFKTFSGDDVLIQRSALDQIPNEGRVFSKHNATIIGSVSVNNIVAVFLDNLLQPPTSLAETAQDLGWTRLVSLLQLYVPKPTIAKLKDFTVFVPSEDVIAALLAPCGGISNVNQAAVNALIENHIYPGSPLYNHHLKNLTMTSLVMASNQTYPVTNTAGVVTIGTAKVTATQYLINGGVVHVVDSANVPDGLNICQ